MQVFYYNGNDKLFCEEMIFPLLKGNICGNAPFIPRFHQIPAFICLVENLRTSLRKIYGKIVTQYIMIFYENI